MNISQCTVLRMSNACVYSVQFSILVQVSLSSQKTCQVIEVNIIHNPCINHIIHLQVHLVEIK